MNRAKTDFACSHPSTHVFNQLRDAGDNNRGTRRRDQRRFGWRNDTTESHRRLKFAKHVESFGQKLFDGVWLNGS